MLLNPFDTLGRDITATWQRHGFDAQSLVGVAVEALTRHDLPKHVSGLDIAKWISRTDTLPQQADLKSRFGQPPLTLFWHEHFRIEALHWTWGTPEIHEHSFSGAFCVLEGSSLQTRYTFETTKVIAEHMRLGHLTVESVALLSKGSVEPIASGARLIHSVFHLDTPSISIVVRTHRDVDAGPQFSYRAPHLAVDSFHTEAVARRRVQLAGFLKEWDAPHYKSFLLDSLEHADIYGTYLLLDHLWSVRDVHIAECVSTATARWGEDIDVLCRVLDERRRQQRIRLSRARITDSSHRFLLALLLSFTDGARILEAIAMKFPDRDPVALAATWIDEISATSDAGNVDTTARRAALALLISGLSPADATRDVVARVGLPETPASILMTLCSNWHRSDILRPLTNRASAFTSNPLGRIRPI
jgi:hypothetical protein